MEGGTSSSDSNPPDLEHAVKAIIMQIRKLKGHSGKKFKKRAHLILGNLDTLIDDAHEAGLDPDD